MTIMIRLCATRRPTMRWVAAAAVLAVGLGGVARAAPPSGDDAAREAPAAGAPRAGAKWGKAVTGIHEMGGGDTKRGVDVDPVSPGGVGSGISTNTQPSSVGGAGSVGSSTTASPTSR